MMRAIVEELATAIAITAFVVMVLVWALAIQGG
jgi:hypothetical protein